MKQKAKGIVHIFIFSLILLSSIGLFAPDIYAANSTPAATSTTYESGTSLVKSLFSGQICEPDNTPNGYKTNLGRCVNNIYLFAISIGSFIAVLMFVLAGYLYIQGTEENIESAKSMMGSTLLGLGILFGTYLILHTIDPELTSIPAIDVQTFSCNQLFPDYATNKDAAYQKGYSDCQQEQNGGALPIGTVDCKALYPDWNSSATDDQTKSDKTLYNVCVQTVGSGATAATSTGAATQGSSGAFPTSPKTLPCAGQIPLGTATPADLPCSANGIDYKNNSIVVKTCNQCVNLNAYQGNSGLSVPVQTDGPVNPNVNINLANALLKLEAINSDWMVSEAWPPTVSHTDACHQDGGCVDIVLKGHSKDSTTAVNVCLAIKKITDFTHFANEFGAVSSDTFTGAGCNAVASYATTTGSNFHVSIDP